MDKDTADKLRGMVKRATIKNVRDDGETQLCSVEVAEGIWRDDVEISQPFGLASSVPEDGALALVLAVGGDEGDLVVLPVANPSKRMGGLQPGEVGLYNEHGDKMVIGADGAINIAAGASLTVKVGGVTVVIDGGGLATTGGQVTHNGKNVGDTHIHLGVVPGSGTTDVPA